MATTIRETTVVKLQNQFSGFKSHFREKSDFEDLLRTVDQKIHDISGPGCASWGLGVVVGAGTVAGYIGLEQWFADKDGTFPAEFMFTYPPLVALAIVVIALIIGTAMITSKITDYCNKELTQLETLRDDIQTTIRNLSGEGPAYK